MTHICVGKQTIIDSDNGLSPGRRQAIIWTNAGILLIGSLGTNFNEILIGIQTSSFKKMHLKMSSAKWRPFHLGLNVFITHHWNNHKLLKESKMVNIEMSPIKTSPLQWLAKTLSGIPLGLAQSRISSLTLTECTLQLGVYTPKPLCYHSHRSVHSNHTPNIISVH